MLHNLDSKIDAPATHVLGSCFPAGFRHQLHWSKHPDTSNFVHTPKDTNSLPCYINARRVRFHDYLVIGSREKLKYIISRKTRFSFKMRGDVATLSAYVAEMLKEFFIVFLEAWGGGGAKGCGTV